MEELRAAAQHVMQRRGPRFLVGLALLVALALGLRMVAYFDWTTSAAAILIVAALIVLAYRYA